MSHLSYNIIVVHLGHIQQFDVNPRRRQEVKAESEAGGVGAALDVSRGAARWRVATVERVNGRLKDRLLTQLMRLTL